MIDYHSQLVDVLSKVLPTHYEMTITSKTETPCITYLELDNFVSTHGDTLGYSSITYQIKVWGTNLKDLQYYAQKIDEALRPIGFTRTSSQEMYDNNSTMIQKIMAYEAIGYEEYEEE